MQEFSYSELISRNYAYIDDKLQMKMKQTRLVFIGCGLSSGLVEDFARIGFTRFTLIDFDTVEVSNLNRQRYYLDDIGVNKSIVLKEKLFKINPEASIVSIDRKIAGIDDIEQVLEEGDVVINTIDFGADYFHVVSQAQKKGLLAICPLNLGFGGLILCFDKDSGTFYDLLGVEQPATRKEFYLRLFLNNKLKSKLADYFYKKLAALSEDMQQRGYQPQMCIGACMVSAMVITAVIKYLNNEKISMAPEIIYRDVYNI